MPITVTRPFILLISAAFLCACPDDVDSVRSAGDAGMDPDLSSDVEFGADDGLPSCSIATDREDFALGAGERVCFPVEISEGGELQLPTPSGARIWLRDDGQVCMRAAAVEAETTEEVVLEVYCNNPNGSVPVTATQPLTLVTRPVTFRRFAAWQENVDGPLAREYFGMFIDEVDTNSLYVYGGFHYEPKQFTPGFDLWRLDLEREQWTELEWAGEGHQMSGFGTARWPGTRTVLLYGGIEALPDGFALPFGLTQLDYATDPPTFTKLSPSGSPFSGTYQPALFYDQNREVFITVGGQGLSSTHMSIATFDPAANSWAPLDSEGDPEFGKPDGRTGYFWAYDSGTRRLIAYSGERGGADWACNCADDTWLLELEHETPRWRRLDLPDEPIGRRNGLFAFDPVNERFLVFGGTRDGQNSTPGLFALELDHGRERWVQIPMPADGPPMRSSGAMVFDASRHRMLLGFGNGAAVYADLWELALDGAL